MESEYLGGFDEKISRGKIMPHIMPHSKETREKLSKATKKYFKEHPEAGKKHSKELKEYYKTHPHPMKGKKHSKEAKEKMRKSSIEYFKTNQVGKETREKLSKRRIEYLKTHPHPNQGMKFSKETREKMSESRREYYKTHPSAMKGRKHSKETKEKISKSGTEYYKIHPEAREMISKRGKEHYKNHPERKEKSRKRMKKLWQDPEYIKKIIESTNVKPNKSEIKLINFLNEQYPEEWAYNGDFRLGISLGRRIPDFVNVNGRKAVIELFGEYWHSPLLNPKLRGNRTYKATIKSYKKLGYDCLIIWSKELDNMDEVKNKIENF